MDCATDPPPFEAVLSLGLYKSPLSNAVRALKYRGTAGVADSLGQWLTPLIGAYMADSRMDERWVVVPVPGDPQRVAWRGIDHTGRIALALGRGLARPVRRVLVKTRATPPQVGLDQPGRVANLEGSLECGQIDSPVCLVDDVVTTGATIRACAAALKAHGAPRVLVAAAARAPRLYSRRV